MKSRIRRPESRAAVDARSPTGVGGVGTGTAPPFSFATAKDDVAGSTSNSTWQMSW